MEDFYNISETRVCKALFPNTLNANNTLFGGLGMQWMDEVAFIAATRFTKQHMFTANTGNIKFLNTVPCNSIIEVVGRVIKAEAVRLTVRVEIYAEDMYDNKHYLAIKGDFILVSLNSKNKPQRIDYSHIEKHIELSKVN